MGFIHEVLGKGVEFVFARFALERIILVAVASGIEPVHRAEGFAVASGLFIQIAFEIEYDGALFPRKKLGDSQQAFASPRWGFDQDVTKFPPCCCCFHMQEAGKMVDAEQETLRW